ncbi:hypothetical protein G9A89_011996 [Geosiphon pyriformis]|nr:hypothetical protein G9A89_011996 [Geosiphon pyriformis]
MLLNLPPTYDSQYELFRYHVEDSSTFLLTINKQTLKGPLSSHSLLQAIVIPLSTSKAVILLSIEFIVQFQKCLLPTVPVHANAKKLPLLVIPPQIAQIF